MTPSERNAIIAEMLRWVNDNWFSRTVDVHNPDSLIAHMERYLTEHAQPAERPTDGEIFRSEASVTSDLKLSLETHASHGASFDQVRAAMVVVRDEFNRILSQGSTKCPYRHHQGYAMSAQSQKEPQGA